MLRPAIHPGELLAEELEELSMTPTELARQLRVPANRITQIVQGKRSITGDTALRLGHWFGTSGRGRDASYLAPPAQTRTCSFPAYGSHLGYELSSLAA